MANNRVYLVHEPTGLAVFLGKRFGWDYFLSGPSDERLEAINDFYEAVAASGEGLPDQMRLGFEIDEIYAEGKGDIDNEIDPIVDSTLQPSLERVKFKNRHIRSTSGG